MDWTSVVEWNAKRLQRILAMLVAMAGLRSTPSSPLVGEEGSARRGEAETLAGPGEGCCEEREPITLPRCLHRAILRQLRPLESATRRLIIIAARDLPVPELPPSRPRKPEPGLKAAQGGVRGLQVRLGLARPGRRQGWNGQVARGNDDQPAGGGFQRPQLAEDRAVQAAVSSNLPP